MHWDSLHLAARDLLDLAWIGLRGKLVEAFEALRGLIGYPEFTPEDLPFAAITHAFVKDRVFRSRVSQDRCSELCQMVASNLYHLPAPGAA